MKLFKDFLDGRICFYWCDESGRQLSPSLATVQESEEWWKGYMFSLYKGPERRGSIHDRRCNHEKRRRMSEGETRSYGRRLTDSPVKVDCNLAVDKITLLSKIAGYEARRPVRL